MPTHRNRSLFVGLAVVLAATFAFAPAANADRRSSLAGNLLIEDSDDIWLYPHLLTEYARMISFDLAIAGADGPSTNAVPQAGATTSPYGNAVLVFGSEQAAFAVATHRSDFWGGVIPNYYLMGDLDQMYGVSGINTIVHPGPLFPAGVVDGGADPLLAPLQWVDLLGAMDMGGQPIGGRLSIGHNRQTLEVQSDAGDAVTNRDATSINLNIGTRINGQVKADISGDLGVGFQSFEDETTQSGTLRTIDTLGLNLGLTGRAFVPMAQGVDLGIVGLLYYRSLSGTREFDNDPANNKYEFDLFSAGLDVGAGPVYHLDDKFTISGYGTIGLRVEDDEPNDSVDYDEENRTLIGIPMLKLAGEYQLFEWMVLRTGAHFIYNFTFADRETQQDVDRSTSFTASSFRWVSGLGIMWEGLEINGTFNAPFLLNGPDFIGGGGNGMFGLLNVMYAF